MIAYPPRRVRSGCLETDTLVAYIDGDASDEVRTRVTTHAAECTTCRSTLSMLAGAEAPRRTIGRYVLERELGAGGMGVVYAARDPELDRTVALKLLHSDGTPEMQGRLRREAQTMAQLAHPNVVRIYDVGESAGHIFLAMELIEGETLGHWQRSGEHPIAEVLARYREAARGLAAAHAEGIVHRDFKPENVLLGPGGACVADFGLAFVATELAQPLAGTPFYMAPELYRGSEADARSDQYAFAVSLYGALCSEQPFAGTTVPELVANKQADKIRPLARGVPRRVRKAVERALAADPAQRFASMDALAHELVLPRRTWIAVPVALAAVAGAAAFVLSGHSEACSDAADELARAWNPIRRAALSTAVAASGLPFAGATEREVERTFDRYATDWQTMRTGACRATKFQAVQSEEVLGLRIGCLEQRLTALGALVSTLTDRDPQRVANAVAASHALPAIQDCADVAALALVVKPPSAAIAMRVKTLRAQITRLDARRDAAELRGTLESARGLEPEVTALDYRPLEAELALLLGHLEEDREHFPAARTAYERALLAGHAGRVDRLAARAQIAIVGLLGHHLGKTADADAQLVQARAELERLDHPADLEAEVATASARNALEAGRFDEGARDAAHAIALVEQREGPTDLGLVEPLHFAAAIELGRNRPEPARTFLARALAIQRGVVGETHPEYASTLEELAGVEYETSNYDRALVLYQQARGIIARTYGPESLAVANIDSNIANVYEWQGESERALQIYEHAVAVLSAQLGADHPRTLSQRYSVGALLEDLDRHADALAELADVLARQERTLGDHPDTARTLHMIGFVEFWLQRYPDALAHARASLAMARRTLGDSYGAFDELHLIGRIELALDHPAAALDALREAEAATQSEDPSNRALLDADYARALIDSGTDRAKGLALFHTAHAILLADPRADADRAILEAWVTKRGL